MHVVVSTVQQHQAGEVDSAAVFVVVQRAVFFHNSGIQQDLAVCVNAVCAHGNVAVGVAQPHTAVGGDLTAPLSVVVIAVFHDHTGIGLCAVHVVDAVVDAVEHFQLAVCTEGVHTLGLQTVAALYPQCLIPHRNSAFTDAVNRTVNLHQTCIGQTTTLEVVIQLTVFFYNGSIHQHLAVFIEAVSAGRNIVAGIADPAVLAVHSSIVAKEVVVIAVNEVQAGVLRQGIDHVIQITVIPVQAILCLTDELAVVIKLVPGVVHTVGRTYRRNTGHCVILFKEVALAFDILPALLVVERSVVVLQTLLRSDPHAAKQLAVIKLIGHAGEFAFIRTVNALTGYPVEQIPLLTDLMPALAQLTQTGIVGAAVHLEQAGIRLFGGCKTIFVKQVVLFVDQYRTCHLFTVYKVAEAAIFHVPAVLDFSAQCEAVVKFLVGIGELTAAIVGIVGGVVVSGQAEGLLILRLLREGVQGAGAHINGVGNLAVQHYFQPILAVPLGIVLGGDLNAAEDTQGVGICLIDGLTLTLPAQICSQGIGLLVVDHIFQGEIIVDHLQLGVVHIHIVAELDCGANNRQVADTLCKAQQEGPGGRICQVTAGQHIGQIPQFLGNGNLGHINGENVGGSHLLACIFNHIGHAVNGCGVGNVPIPSKLAVTAGSLIEVEGGFALLEQVNHNRATACRIALQAHGHFHLLDLAVYLSGKAEACANNGGSGVAQGKGDIAIVDGNGLIFIQRADRQCNRLTVHSVNIGLGEVNAVRNDHIHGLAAYQTAVQIDLYFHCAVTQGSEFTVFGNGCHGFVTDCPGCALRQLYRITGSTDTGGSHLYGSANGHIRHFGIYHCVVELGGAGCGGNHEQGGTDGTGVTVRRSVDHLQLGFAFRSCHEGGRSAAVQIDCGHTAGFQHNLCNFNHTAAAGIGLLTTVQYHHHDLTGLGNTDGGTACTALIVIRGSGDVHLTVLHQHGAEACNSFLYPTLVGIPLVTGADDCSAIVQNAHKTVAVNGMILHATHNQNTGGLTVTHIVTAGVGADHHLIVFDIIGTFGIAPAILCGLCLIQYAGHLPGTDDGLVVVVVGVQVHVLTGNVCGGNEKYHLLAVCRLGVLDLLCNTGCQNGAFRLEYGVVGVFACLYVVTGQLTHIVCKGVANSLAQCLQILSVKLTGIFQRADHLVVAVGVVDGIAHLVTGACTVQTVLQEVLCTVFHGQLFREVLHNSHRKIAGCILHCQ